MRIHGVSPECFPVQIYARGKPKSRLMREGSDGMRFDFSQRENEGKKGLKSAARAREPSRAFDFGVFSLVTFFGRAKRVTKAKKSDFLRFILDKSENSSLLK